MDTKTQISTPTRKPRPTKSFKALIIFSVFAATVSGGIREWPSYLSDRVFIIAYRARRGWHVLIA